MTYFKTSIRHDNDQPEDDPSGNGTEFDEMPTELSELRALYRDPYLADDHDDEDPDHPANDPEHFDGSGDW